MFCNAGHLGLLHDPNCPFKRWEGELVYQVRQIFLSGPETINVLFLLCES